MSALGRLAWLVTFLGSATLLGAASVNLQEVFALYGSTHGIAGAFFGRSITGVGDQNGDGFDDVLIANNFEKKAFLYLGGSPMDTLPARVFQRGETGFASEVANLGDVNMDGKTEFAILSGPGIYIYRGASLDTVPMLKLPGPFAHVAGMGDVNGDGFADVLASDPAWNTSRGRTWIFFGGNPMNTIPDWSADGDSTLRWFGYSIAGNGDLNHDGFKDFAIAEFNDQAVEAPARIKIYFGGSEIDTIPVLLLDGRILHGLNPHACIVADINGDHYDELAAPSLADTGAFVFFGRDTLKNVPDLILQGSGVSSPLNLRIASVGDVNGDGNNDILTGNQSAWNGLGEVLLYLGKPQMTGKPDFVTRGYYGAWEGAGQEVAWCGDVNHDGLNDIMFSAYAPDFLTQNGKVEIFAGNRGLIVSADLLTDQENVPAGFSLEPNFPNPFNPSTQITYALAQGGEVSLDVFDVIGRKIATLVNGFQGPGVRSATWNAASTASGVYFARMTVVDGAGRLLFSKVTKCLLAR